MRRKYLALDIWENADNGDYIRLFSLILTVMLGYFASLSFMFQLPRLVLMLGGNESEAGFLLGTTLFADVVLSPLAGFLVARFAFRPLLLFGLITYTLSTGLMCLVDTVGQTLYIVRFMQGVGHAFIYVPCFTVVSAIIPTERKASGLAMFAISVQIGNLIGSLMGAIIIENLDVTWFFLAAVGWTVVAMVPATRVWSPTLKTPGLISGGKGGGLAPGFLAGVVFSLVIGGAFCTVMQFIPTYFDRLYNIGILARPLSASTFLSSALASMVTIRLLIGRAGDGKFRRQLAFGSCATVIFSIAMIPVIQGMYTSILLGVLFGCGYGLLYPTVMALILSNLCARNAGTPVGILASAYQVGYLGIPFLLGPSIELLGYNATFVMVACALLGSWTIFVLCNGPVRSWFFVSSQA